MSNEFIAFILVALSIAAYVQAYNWGWHAGHDVHHDDSEHGPNRINKDNDKPSLWV